MCIFRESNTSSRKKFSYNWNNQAQKSSKYMRSYNCRSKRFFVLFYFDKIDLWFSYLFNPFMYLPIFNSMY